MAYIPGDHKVLCDRCGFVKLRSQCRKTWDKLLVCAKCWFPRHPQESVKAKTDKQSVSDPRPDTQDFFNSTTLSAAASKDDLTITVASISGISDGDSIGIVLDTYMLTAGDQTHWTTVNGDPSTAIISDGSLINEDCSNITDWTDSSTGTAEATQTTFDSKSCFKFDTKVSAAGNTRANLVQNIGSVDALGNTFTVSIDLYCDAIGTITDIDHFPMQVYRSDMVLYVGFASDGLFIDDGDGWNEVETNIITQDTWQEWTFKVDVSAGVANAVCDVRLDSILQASDVDCSYTGSFTDGRCNLIQFGYGNDDRITYMNLFKVGNELSRTVTLTEALPGNAASGNTVHIPGDNFLTTNQVQSSDL